MNLLAAIVLLASLDTGAERDLLSAHGELCSPYYEVRSRAQSRLLGLRIEDGQRAALALLASDDPRFRLAGVEWYRQQIRLGRESQVDALAFLAGYAKETDRAVRERSVLVAAGLESAMPELRASRARGELSESDLAAIVDARLLHLCMNVMHDGGVPGFFDGQFAAMHELIGADLSPMVRVARDPRVHFVVRALMIMALHEPRPKDLEAYFLPLLIDPVREVEIQRRFKDRLRYHIPITTSDIRADLVAKLSQYARFSLAKAGIAGAIDAKIEVLKREAAAKLKDAEKYGEGFGYSKELQNRLLEDAMDYVFEIGYHHQQLDRYDAAENAYRTIVEREENIDAKAWAHYNLACIRAITGHPDEAIAELELAVKSGFSDMRWAARDGDLKSLRDDPRFRRALSGQTPRKDD